MRYRVYCHNSQLYRVGIGVIPDNSMGYIICETTADELSQRLLHAVSAKGPLDFDTIWQAFVKTL